MLQMLILLCGIACLVIASLYIVLQSTTPPEELHHHYDTGSTDNSDLSHTHNHRPTQMNSDEVTGLLNVQHIVEFSTGSVIQALINRHGEETEITDTVSIHKRVHTDRVCNNEHSYLWKVEENIHNIIIRDAMNCSNRDIIVCALLASYTDAGYVVAFSDNRVGVTHISNVNTVDDVHSILKTNVIAEMEDDGNIDIPLYNVIELLEANYRGNGVESWRYIPNNELLLIFDEYLDSNNTPSLNYTLRYKSMHYATKV